jgi:hypothetical protein
MAVATNSLTFAGHLGYGAEDDVTTIAESGVVPVQHAEVARPCIPLVLPGGALLALAMSLRARGLRGLDVLRRSVDRAPPTAS